MRHAPALLLAAGCQQGVAAALLADVVVPADVLAAHADEPLVVLVRWEGEPAAAVPICRPHDQDVVVRLQQSVSAPGPCLDYRAHAALLHLDGACEEPDGWPDRGRWMIGPLDAYDASVPPSAPLDPEVTAFDLTSRWTCSDATTTGSLTLAAEE